MITRINIHRIDAPGEIISTADAAGIRVGVQKGQTVMLISSDMHYPITGPCIIVVPFAQAAGSNEGEG